MKKNQSFVWFFMAAIVIAFITANIARADDPTAAPVEVFHSDFGSQTFDTAGWTSKAALWKVHDMATDKPDLKNDPGSVAFFPATPKDYKGTDLLVRKFPTATELTLTFDAGWGWGSADQGADGLGIMLLDDDGNGYLFELHRAKAKWGAQWAVVTKYVHGKMNFASDVVDGTQAAVVDGGGLQTFTIKKVGNTAWTFGRSDWAAPLSFADTTTMNFTQVALVGGPNFDCQLFNKIKLETPPATP